MSQREARIDWRKVPELYKWLTLDEDGVTSYEKEPEWQGKYFVETNKGAIQVKLDTSIIVNAPKDWKQCKFKRP